MTNPPEVLLFTREGCHLCDDALALLREHGLQPTLIDIDRDPGLRERYDVCVPVVVIDGKERFRGRVDRRLLARLLRGRG
ncbi:MAG: glutaredoxin family protein [Pirellulales bacterium]|nr:glutaredoxin family protein [Pirellulales bacterium]